MSSDEGEWLHKVHDTEKMFIWGHRAGTRYSTPVYTFNSRKPITQEVFHQGMLHLHRKTPVCQVAAREREGELWWCKPRNVDIDVKILEKGTPVVDVVNALWREGFDDANGPLLKGRLIPANDEDPCLFPEIKEQFPYQYYMVSNPHHSVLDGISLAFICQPMIDLINAVIEGENIDDSAPTGVFVSSEEYEKADLMFKERLNKDPERLEEVKKEVLKSSKSPILLKGFPRPHDDNPMTKHVFIDLEPKVYHNFLDKCKENGIVYGSGFQAATSAALVELVQDTGCTDDSYDVSVNFTIDLRRYMKQRDHPILGLHARTMASLTNMNKNVRDHFWENCRYVQKVNKDMVKTGSAVEQDVVRQLFMPQVPPEKYFKTLPEVIRDFGINNVGPFDRVMHGKGKHVQLTEINCYTSAHRFIFSFYQQLFTFRGIPNNMISYATDWMTDETANLLVQKIKSIIAHVSQK